MNIITSKQVVTMSSREIAELVNQRHDNVKRTIETLGTKGVISYPQFEDGQKAANGVVEKIYQLGKRDSLIVVAQLCPEYTAVIVDRWQELEAKEASGLIAMPNFSNPAEAARAWAAEYEARQLAEQTKAQIGHRREATAMNTASQAVKKATKLEIEMDKSMQYATIKRMEMLYHGQSFNWRLLKSAAADLGVPPIDTFDANYGTVKSYHADVWREAYALEIDTTI